MSFKRLATLTVAYLCACLTAGSIFGLGFELWMPSSSVAELLRALFFFAAFYSVFVILFALIPAAVGIVVAERAAIDRPRWFALGGAAIGLGSLGIMTLSMLILSNDPFGRLRDPGVDIALASDIAIVAFAGACAGLMFWTVAVWLPGRTRILWPRAAP